MTIVKLDELTVQTVTPAGEAMISQSDGGIHVTVFVPTRFRYRLAAALIEDFDLPLSLELLAARPPGQEG